MMLEARQLDDLPGAEVPMYDPVLGAPPLEGLSPPKVAGEAVRAGSRTLSIFGYSLNARVLRAHAEGPLRTCELQERIAWAPQSSLRAAVTNLCDRGILAKLEPDDRSQATTTALTPAGWELLPVAATLERWLQRAPDGPIALDTAAASGVVRVLTAGWDSTMVRAMAERPLTLNEISDGIADLNYPALKRRLAKLRSTGLVKPVRQARAATYGASDWLRLSVVPLAVAGRWERLHDPEAQPISAVEVDAAFLLTLPFLQLPSELSGSCTLAVVTSEEQDAADPEVAGVAVEVDRGKVVSCRSETSPPSGLTTWALGTVDTWLHAVLDGNAGELRVSGAEPGLARAIVTSLHETLFRG